MAKKRRTYSKKKKKTNKKSSAWKSYFFIALFISCLIFAFSMQEEIKITYLKLRATYISYQEKYATKQESTKIEKIISKHQNHIFGIDVSHYQGIINWQKVDYLEDSIPVGFAIIRATAGNNRKDNYFTYNWREAKKNNILRAAYHYYRPNENSAEQAAFFIDKVKLESGDLAPILDIEEEPKIQSIASLRKGIQNWLNIVEAHYGKKPIIYTGDSFYTDYLKNQGFDDYPIWIANYNNNITKPRNKNWIIWQFSDKGTVNGINEFVDLNVFDGNEKMLRLLTLE